VLGIAAEDVNPSVADTDSIGYTAVTGGSRTTFATGWAAWEAAQDVMRQLKERAAKLWEVDAASVTAEAGVFRSGEHVLTFRELAARLGETGGPVVGRGAVNPKGVGGSFSGCITDVEVDPETGKVPALHRRARRRKAIPSYVEGRCGRRPGIGWALNEILHEPDGICSTPASRTTHATARSAVDTARRGAKPRASLRRARVAREHRSSSRRHRRAIYRWRATDIACP
jgi:hypothetical protein